MLAAQQLVGELSLQIEELEGAQGRFETPSTATGASTGVAGESFGRIP
jgi:hypothetical protein